MFNFKIQLKTYERYNLIVVLHLTYIFFNFLNLNFKYKFFKPLIINN